MSCSFINMFTDGSCLLRDSLGGHLLLLNCCLGLGLFLITPKEGRPSPLSLIWCIDSIYGSKLVANFLESLTLNGYEGEQSLEPIWCTCTSSESTIDQSHSSSNSFIKIDLSLSLI
ncbi:unnamed protein product [Moneuplotes crassus]|uniref:Uncharacterized protein n=1 Tax=Euplotes crassus TaxID=5936 RepID=A0AAD1XAC1_EUPCR|nr:unnamed protein product [Moneuplotes crassus]